MVLFHVLKFGALILMVVFGIAQTIAYFAIRRQFDQMPIVAAEITESKLVDYIDVERRRTYEAKIKFKYNFRGVEYESDQPALTVIRLFPAFGYESELSKKYPKGAIVNAHIVPSNPKLAYLEVAPFDKLSAILLPIISIGLILYFVGVGYFFSFFNSD